MNISNMEHILKALLKDTSGGEHGSHAIYWVPLKTFNELPIKRWKFNRPPDEDRVIEIREYMKTSQRMDGIIYLAYVDNELVCYESNHRREALKGLETIADILIDVIWGASDDLIKQEFVRLNKAVSVPKLYIDVNSEVYKATLWKVVDDFCKAYKSHVKPSDKPRCPHFSRDTLTEEFDRIIKEQNISIDTFVVKLTDYNKRLMLKDRSKLSKAIVDKCSSTGLWLFAWSTKLNDAEFL